MGGGGGQLPRAVVGRKRGAEEEGATNEGKGQELVAVAGGELARYRIDIHE